LSLDSLFYSNENTKKSEVFTFCSELGGWRLFWVLPTG
jgi:hypothetical protein